MISTIRKGHNPCTGVGCRRTVRTVNKIPLCSGCRREATKARTRARAEASKQRARAARAARAAKLEKQGPPDSRFKYLITAHDIRKGWGGCITETCTDADALVSDGRALLNLAHVATRCTGAALRAIVKRESFAREVAQSAARKIIDAPRTGYVEPVSRTWTLIEPEDHEPYWALILTLPDGSRVAVDGNRHRIVFAGHTLLARKGLYPVLYIGDTVQALMPMTIEGVTT